MDDLRQAWLEYRDNIDESTSSTTVDERGNELQRIAWAGQTRRPTVATGQQHQQPNNQERRAQAARERKNELQRQRRAARRRHVAGAGDNVEVSRASDDADVQVARVGGNLDVEVSRAGADDDVYVQVARVGDDLDVGVSRAGADDDVPVCRDQERRAQAARERKNELQRQRRAARRRHVAGAGDNVEVSRASDDADLQVSCASNKDRIRNTDAGVPSRASKQRDARRKLAAEIKAKDKELMDDLSARVLDARDLTVEEVEWMGKKQRFLQDPRLALAYYYCCGTDPRSFVFGDEQLQGDDGEGTKERVLRLLDDYPKATEVAACQRAVLESAPESTTVWACASCGTILLQNKLDGVLFSTLEELHTIRLSDDEREKLFAETPQPVARLYRQLYFHEGDIYFLIPELVCNHERIPLCGKCHADPRKSKFSVCAGHDYGRVGELPALNEVALSCISPVRCFGLALSLSGKHSTGHAICFPTNGPCEVARTLPRIDDECVPRVTFIGPHETWRVQRRKFAKLYDIPVDDVYKWLAVLSSVNSDFKEDGIEIEDSPRRRKLLCEMELAIQKGVRVSDSAEAVSIDEVASSGVEASDCGSNMVGSAESPDVVLVRGSAVLPPIEQSGSPVAHEIISAMADAVGPSSSIPVSHPRHDDSVHEHDSGQRPLCQQPRSDDQQRQTVIPIKRGRAPFVEWVDNAKLLAGAFPNLFLTGSGPLPSGPLPRDYVDHFMHYWDGRFEKSLMFTTLLFNQLQRHAAVQKAARVGVTHGKTMEKFGKLISTDKFKKALEFAKLHPDSKEAVRMNAGLLRLLSLVGGTVPFSPFERAATRPKLGAMRYRYGIALHWVTMAPPEHDDLLLHRIASLRKTGGWNDENSIYARKECRFTDFEDAIQKNAKARLGVSALYPALSAQVFERRLKALTNDIIRCPDSSTIRTSTNVLEAQCGVYGRCAAFNAVIEPQVDGRLHAHLTVYGSAMNPSLLGRISCCPDLLSSTRKYLDAVSCTTIPESIRDWCESWRKAHDGRLPRAFEVEVPDASKDYEGFMDAAKKRVTATNIHSHSTTCRKGARGRYMCRLSRPAGVHDGDTQPICVRVKVPSVLGKRQRAEFVVRPVKGSIADLVDAKFDYSNKRIVRQHANGAVIWEQRRPQRDAMLVETNLPLACLTSSHTNSAIMNGEDAGDMVEEYQQSYMTKEKGGLKSATAVMHSAVSDILKYPSVADDSGSDLRTAKHLATRTVNAFSGANEWSHALMAYALAGYRSYISSDTFWFVFPHKLVEYIQSNAANECATTNVSASIPEERLPAESVDCGEQNDAGVQDEIDDLVAFADEDGARSSNYVSGTTNTGARMYRQDDKMVLVTQAESYRYRGTWFDAYSPLEFEMIVDILPRSDQTERDPSQRGRPPRQGFDLAPGHPLAPQYQGFIRAKFKTPMLGGAPPPSLKNGRPSTALSKYLVCLLTPWQGSGGLLSPADMSSAALIRLCESWNSSGATFLNRQRYQYMHNILKKRCRSSQNEKVCSEWRSRNTDYWDQEIATRATEPVEGVLEATADDQASQRDIGLSMSPEEIFELTVAATAKCRTERDAVKALKDDFWALVPDKTVALAGEARAQIRDESIFRDDGTSLARIARSIHKMRPPSGNPETAHNNEDSSTTGDGPVDNFRTKLEDENMRLKCSLDQRVVFDLILQSMNGARGLNQTLLLLHGGGGTGKSTLIRRIVSTLERHGIKTVSTCPTGVGASHLRNGRTFHSAFKTNRSVLSANDLELLRLTFTDDVWLIIVDEVSMLATDYFVLLDVRLRTIYRNNLPFGGRSVVLSGDFLQLKVPSGWALCKTLYTNSKSASHLAARVLFRRFRACFLTQQHRAASCPIQQANLEACRVCPDFFPGGDEWTSQEKHCFRPITDQVAKSVTRELDMDTVARDPKWLDDMTILVTSNFDKAVLTSCTSRLYAMRNQRQLFRWKREVKKSVSPEIKEIIYDEDVNPELFAYFVAGAPAQVLDNNNGNVSWGVANGSPCKLHSLAWQDADKTLLVQQLVERAESSGKDVVDLPFPPDFINVQLVEWNGNLRTGHDWPHENNLETEFVDGPTGHPCKKASSYRWVLSKIPSENLPFIWVLEFSINRLSWSLSNTLLI